MAPFRVGVTRDFLKPDGTPGFGDIGLELLDEADNLAWDFLSENTAELVPEQLSGYDALLVLAPRVTARSLDGNERLVVVARFGVGYDNVDVEACTEHGVLLTITPDGVRRPVASAAMTFVLALSQKLLIKDRLTRDGRWAEKLDHMGMGVTGRTLGIVGLGNIGRDLATLAMAHDMNVVAHDPQLTSAEVDGRPVELLDLEELLAAADFVCICCALTPQTRHLINAERLARMKPSAYLINVARGPIVDQQALTACLRERRIGGAGLDVFEDEPIARDDPLLGLDNVIVTPHAICWTDECFRGNGLSACRSLLDVARGHIPRNVVNRAALNHPRLRDRLRGRMRENG